MKLKMEPVSLAKLPNDCYPPDTPEDDEWIAALRDEDGLIWCLCEIASKQKGVSWYVVNPDVMPVQDTKVMKGQKAAKREERLAHAFNNKNEVETWLRNTIDELVRRIHSI